MQTNEMTTSSTTRQRGKYLKREGITQTTSEKAFHCLELFAIPPSLASDSSSKLEHAGCARDLEVQRYIHSRKGQFPKNYFSRRADISCCEQIVVLSMLFLVMGMPLLWMLVILPLTMIFGTWKIKALFVVATFFLAFHPLPPIDRRWLRRSYLTFAFYKYFSYRFLWTGNIRKEAQTSGPWIGPGTPHGVLPFANILSCMAIESFSFLPFPLVGAPASVVFRTPFLRYLTLICEMCHVDRKSLTRELSRGRAVGLVADGIAGIFQCTELHETVYLKERKGLAKLALRTGASIFPAYSLGNTEAFSAWYDSYGIMETMSRKLQVSIFLYWGRFGLPVPHRTPIALLIGEPIHIAKAVESPTQSQIDEVHDRFLRSIRKSFDEHKGALGWGHKKIQFV